MQRSNFINRFWIFMTLAAIFSFAGVCSAERTLETKKTNAGMNAGTNIPTAARSTDAASAASAPSVPALKTPTDDALTLDAPALNAPAKRTKTPTLDAPTLDAPAVKTKTPAVKTTTSDAAGPKTSGTKSPADETTADAAPAVSASAEVPSITADLILPKSTCGYISIRDIAVLRDAWQKTSLGELQQTPEMQDFFKSLQQQLSDGLSVFHSRLGVTLDEIGQMASHEIAGGLLQLDAEHYGIAVVINVGDKQYETQNVVNRIVERVTKNGGSHQKQQVDGAEIYVLNIPDEESGNVYKAYYVLKGELLIAADKPEIVREMLRRLAVLQSDSSAALESLSEVDAYLDVLDATIVDDKLPDVIWYVDPIRFLRVQRLMQIEKDPSYAKSRSIADLLESVGFGGIEAVGGVATFRHQGFDSTQRVFVCIPEEPKLSLKMLAFDEKGNFDLPDWVTDDVGTVHILNLDFLTMFDNLGPLVNQAFGEGSDTVWEDVLDGFETDPYGPQLNLRKDLVGLLENKLIFMVQNMAPKMIDGERCLIAVPVKDEAKMRENLGALLNEEPTFEVLENNGDIRWKLVDEEQEEGDAGSEIKGKRFPEMTITVWDGYLIIASEPGYIDYLQSLDLNKTKPLAESEVYLKIKSEVEQYPETKVSFHFVNGEKLREHTYEMAKNGTLAESAATHSSVLGEFLKNGSKNSPDRKPLDTSKLPEYDLVKSYFLPSGGFLFQTEKGLIYQGFWMSKEKMGK